MVLLTLSLAWGPAFPMPTSSCCGMATAVVGAHATRGTAVGVIAVGNAAAIRPGRLEHAPSTGPAHRNLVHLGSHCLQLAQRLQHCASQLAHTGR